MVVLIACEESQTSCIAFRDRGIECYSADIKPCSGGHPEWHIQGDVRLILNEPWDIIIAHPPCTFLSRACPGGIHNPDRYDSIQVARAFFYTFYNLDCKAIAIENPVPFRGLLPIPDQIVEPYFFGDPYTKKTCLWLRGLPELVATNIVRPVASWTAIHSSPTMRSKSFPGLSAAFADQWGLGYCQKTFF